MEVKQERGQDLKTHTQKLNLCSKKQNKMNIEKVMMTDNLLCG